MRILVYIILMMFFSGCSKDPHGVFVGSWTNEAKNSFHTIRILNDDGRYKLLSDILNLEKQELYELIKDGDGFIVQYKDYPPFSIESTDDENLITINNKTYKKINPDDLDLLKTEMMQYEFLKKDEITARRLESAIKEYHLDLGEYPSELNQLVSDTGNKMWLGPYVRDGDIKDSWGNNFVYELNDMSFTLMSLGKDNKVGGDGANEDQIFTSH